MKRFPTTFSPIQSLGIMIVVCIVLLLSLLVVNRVSADQHQDPAAPDAPGSIAGVVKDGQGAPLAGIRITLFGPQYESGWYLTRVVTTTASGAYKVPVLPTALYRLRATDPKGRYGPLYYPQSPTVEGATDISVVGDNVTNINLTLTAAAQITGIVTILNELLPTDGYVTVYAQVDESWQVVSSHSLTHTGHYTAGPLPAGTFRLCAWANPNVDAFYGCYGGEAQPEEATDITLTAGETKANVTIVVGQDQYNGAITGTVTAAGVGVAGIQVNLYGYSYYGQPLAYTLTDANGHYTIGGLRDGGYDLQFFDPAAFYAKIYHNNQRIPLLSGVIPIVQGAVLSNVNAALVAGGTISGTIRNNNGQPVNAEVSVSYIGGIDSFGAPVWTSGESERVQTDQRGHYALRPLWPDTYRLCVSSQQLRYSECYGSVNGSFFDASDIVIQAGTVITGLDLIFGPDFVVYLPSIAR